MSNTYRIQHNVTSSDQFKCLSLAAQALYMTLCRLSNRYGNKNEDNWFSRSVRELSDDTGLSIQTIIRVKRELLTAYMIQVITEPDYTKHISTKYRIIQWQKVKFKRSNYYHNVSSNYYHKVNILKKNTEAIKTKLIKPD